MNLQSLNTLPQMGFGFQGRECLLVFTSSLILKAKVVGHFTFNSLFRLKPQIAKDMYHFQVPVPPPVSRNIEKQTRYLICVPMNSLILKLYR